MPINIIVNNQPISYPAPGDEPGWAEGATQFAEEVAEVLDSLQGSDDILQTTFTIDNDQSTPLDVTGLSFNTGSTRAAFIEYSIYRVSDESPSGVIESGLINLVYDNAGGVGQKWLMSQGNITGYAGVSFSITDAGQIQYTSTDIGSTNHTGVMKFKARTLEQ